MGRLQDPRASWLVLGASAILLGTLATLQYHWLGEVSRAEGERLRAGLESALERFALDFDRELARAAVHFLGDRWPPVAGADGADGDGQDFAERLEDWREMAPYPELIRDVLRLERGDGGWNLACLDPSSASFEACDWLVELEDITRRLGAPREGRYLPGPSSRPPFLAPRVPAALIPRMSFPSPAAFRPSFSGFYLIRFDLDFIRETLAPALGARHLAWGDQLEFDYGIFSLDAAGNRVPVYLSDPQRPPRHYLEGDRRIEIFGSLPREALRELWFERRSEEPGSARGLRAPAGNRERGRRPFERFPRRGSPLGAAGPRDDGGAMTPEGENRPDRPLGGPPANDSWVLAVRHPEGSLETAVTRARRRNLAVSSGVLLLLGLTVAMLLVSVRRARELAARRVELAAGITHELRTPLAAIRALAQNLADGIVDKPDQTRRYGAQIERQGARLSAMVEQSLELSGILSERQPYVFEPVAVADAVTAALADCRPLLADGGRFETRFAADLPLVEADAAALQKAIQNLLTNAIKYGGDDHWVGIEVSGSTGAAGREVAVRISDHGPGIPRQEQPRLFDAFYRSRDAAEAQVPGSGLGLSLVKHVVDAHGGRVEVHSERGGGSTFTILLPASENRYGEP